MPCIQLIQINVPCYTIQGIARNIEYQPSNRKILPKNNHTWSCVFVDDKWFLCDIIWASNPVTTADFDWCKGKSSVLKSKNTASKHYFLACPLKFRNTHFPTTDNKFQLLSQIITFEQFEGLPIFSECFYDSALANYTPSTDSLVSIDGYYKLSIPCKEDLYFIHLVEYYDENVNKLVPIFESDELIKNYSLLEVGNGFINLYCRFPRIGVYYITLFMQDESVLNLDGNYKACIKWKIECLNVFTEATPFFGCRDLAFGPSWAQLRYFGLTPVNLTRGVMKIDYSPPAYIEACFNKSNPDVYVVAKIRGSKSLLPHKYREESAQDFVSPVCNGYCLDWLIDEEDETDSEITITIRLPTYGEYSLEIYANIPTDGDRFVQVAQYMLDLKKNQADLIDRAR